MNKATRLANQLDAAAEAGDHVGLPSQDCDAINQGAEMLRALEAAVIAYPITIIRSVEGGLAPVCPVCEELAPIVGEPEHKPDCELAKALEILK